MRVNQLPAVIQRKIPGAQLPVQYEEACKALVACTTIDEVKYYSNKADALAVWAKMFKDNTASLAAKRLKLHAYRRMGSLAGELRPTRRLGARGVSKGPFSLLMENGLNADNARAARRLAKMVDDNFIKLVDLPKPPSPLSTTLYRVNGSEAWRVFSRVAGVGTFRAFCRRHAAKQLARGLTHDESIKAREMVIECIEWLDEFVQHLPKAKPAQKST